MYQRVLESFNTDIKHDINQQEHEPDISIIFSLTRESHSLKLPISRKDFKACRNLKKKKKTMKSNDKSERGKELTSTWRTKAPLL